jgi:hypothetical protein
MQTHNSMIRPYSDQDTSKEAAYRSTAQTRTQVALMLEAYTAVQGNGLTDHEMEDRLVPIPLASIIASRHILMSGNKVVKFQIYRTSKAGLRNAVWGLASAQQYCPKCHQAFAVHNDDGSCVTD